MLRPYIGITDFTSYAQVQDMLDVFVRNSGRQMNRSLAVGVMMSYKTLNGLPTEWNNAFPPKERIASIFSSDEVFNCLHYADYADNQDLSKNLMNAISYGGIGIHALQLDMIWPDPREIASGLHASRKQIEVILQIGENALDEVNNDPQAVVERLADYEGVIHRVLLDKSMGRGIGMDAKGLIPFVRAIRERFPTLGIVAAGGLGPETTHLIEPLLQIHPDISMDAQSKLRPSGSALDPIDRNMSGMYLKRALALCAANRKK